MAEKHLRSLEGGRLDVLTVAKPGSTAAAAFYGKVISKLSPLLGNMIEFRTVDFLNERNAFRGQGRWLRQDPGFPDTVFEGDIQPRPGFEIKAWWPLATEITARFKESQANLRRGNTNVAMLAWMLDKVVYGTPYLIGVCIVPGLSVAAARDVHYHQPPAYVVREPEDTGSRTKNLQQTTTTGHKWQGSQQELAKARKVVETWGKDGQVYETSEGYQARLRELLGQFKYRLDTNFAKMDRIEHSAIKAFKSEILERDFAGRSLAAWRRILGKDEQTIGDALKGLL